MMNSESRLKILGIPAPPYWKWKLIIILLLSVVGVWLRLGMNLLTIQYEGLLLPLSIIGLYAYWELFFTINKYLNKWLPFEKSIGWRVFLQLLIGVIILIGSRRIGLYFFKDHINFEMNEFHLLFITIADIFGSSVVNLGFFANYFKKKWSESAARSEQLAKEQIRLQLNQLKNQVNPHLLFNAFSTLESMIYENKELAAQYVRHLSNVYRYNLKHSDQILVSLRQEFEFLETYYSLLKMRYDTAFKIEIEVEDHYLDDYSILILTLQSLIDNAIKHNEISEVYPLVIKINISQDILAVGNRIKTKSSLFSSNGQGLQQMSNLYKLAGRKEVEILQDDHYFEVRVPLIDSFTS
jgi:two-component system LytT family sensor kinase